MKLSAELEEVFAKTKATLTLENFLTHFDHKGFSFFYIILSMLPALPLPAPGIATPFGLAMTWLSFETLTGKKKPSLPKFVLKREIPANINSRLIQFLLKFVRFFETFIRPRLAFIYDNLIFRKFSQILILLCAVSMISPLPLTSSIPSLGIFVISIGTLQEDGLMIILGWLIAIFGIGLSLILHVFLVWFGWEAATALIEQLDQYI